MLYGNESARRATMSSAVLAALLMLAACGWLSPHEPDRTPTPTLSPDPTPAELKTRVYKRGHEIIALTGAVIHSPNPDTDPVRESHTCTAPPPSRDGQAGHGYQVIGAWTMDVGPDDQQQRIRAVQEVWKNRYGQVTTVGTAFVSAFDNAADLNMSVRGMRPERGIVIEVSTGTCWPSPPPTR